MSETVWYDAESDLLVIRRQEDSGAIFYISDGYRLIGAPLFFVGVL